MVAAKLIDTPVFFPHAVKVMDAVSYTAPADSDAQEWATNPNKMAYRVDISSLSAGGQTMTLDIQTSPDGTNWISTGQTVTGINANGTQSGVITVPCMPHVRIAVGESADGPTATVNAWLMADTPTTASGKHDDIGDTPSNFIMCRHAETIDSALAVPTSAAGSSAKLGQQGVEAGYAVWTITGRTAGTIAAQLQTSFDGGTTWVDLASTEGFTAASDASVVKIVKLAGPIGAHIRSNYTSASSWDGAITFQLYVNKNP